MGEGVSSPNPSLGYFGLPLHQAFPKRCGSWRNGPSAFSSLAVRSAAALYRYALRDVLFTALTSDQVDELNWLFEARRGGVGEPSRDPDLTLATATLRAPPVSDLTKYLTT